MPAADSARRGDAAGACDNAIESAAPSECRLLAHARPTPAPSRAKAFARCLHFCALAPRARTALRRRGACAADAPPVMWQRGGGVVAR
eukprot:365605-Chlamydomonas_euryale.AAC.10